MFSPEKSYFEVIERRKAAVQARAKHEDVLHLAKTAVAHYSERQKAIDGKAEELTILLEDKPVVINQIGDDQITASLEKLTMRSDRTETLKQYQITYHVVSPGLKPEWLGVMQSHDHARDAYLLNPNAQEYQLRTLTDEQMITAQPVFEGQLDLMLEAVKTTQAKAAVQDLL